MSRVNTQPGFFSFTGKDHSQNWMQGTFTLQEKEILLLVKHGKTINSYGFPKVPMDPLIHYTGSRCLREAARLGSPGVSWHRKM